MEHRQLQELNNVTQSTITDLLQEIESHFLQNWNGSEYENLEEICLLLIYYRKLLHKIRHMITKKKKGVEIIEFSSFVTKLPRKKELKKYLEFLQHLKKTNSDSLEVEKSKFVSTLKELKKHKDLHQLFNRQCKDVLIYLNLYVPKYNQLEDLLEHCD